MTKIIVTTEEDLRAIVKQSVREEIESALLNNQQKEAGPLLTKSQAAKLLSCSASTIDNYARAGRLTRHYVGENSVRFFREEVLNLAENKPYYKSLKNGN